MNKTYIKNLSFFSGKCYSKMVIFLMIAFSSFSQDNVIRLDSGLVIHYPFHNNLNDESGLKNHLSGSNTQFVTNILQAEKSALYLNNTRLSARLKKSVASSNYSVSFWFKPDFDMNKNDLKNPITFIDGLAHCALKMTYAEGLLNFEFGYEPNGMIGSSMRADFQKGTWYFFQLNFGGKSEIKATIDDKSKILISKDLNDKDINKFNNPLYIGGNSQEPASEFFSGEFDDFRVYNRKLSAEEIEKLYTSQTEADTAPDVSWESPEAKIIETSNDRITIKNCISSYYDLSKIQLIVNGMVVSEKKLFPPINENDPDCNFLIEHEVALNEGKNLVSLKVYSNNNEELTVSDSKTIIYTPKILAIKDLFPPNITLSNPYGLPGFSMNTSDENLVIKGTAKDDVGISKVIINNITAEYDKESSVFKGNIRLSPGENIIKITATDINQNQTEFQFFATYQKADSNQAITYGKRFALVIGNNKYEYTKELKNAANDAYLLSEELRNLGFEVDTLINGKRGKMYNAIENFIDKLKADTTGNSTGLFYFAGHGMQVKDKNYLVPVDANIQTEANADRDCYQLNSLMGQLNEAGNSFNIIILDACRDNPFPITANLSRSGSVNGGLVSVVPPRGVFVAYAAKPGAKASDGNGTNSLYTQTLVNTLRKPKLSIEQVFKTVKKQVYNDTNKEQDPSNLGDFDGDFYFRR